MSRPESRPLALEQVASYAAVEEEWRPLAEEAGNVFATPEWAATWWRHLGRGRKSLLTACRTDEGALAAVLPLYLWRERPVRVARLAGHGPGDALGPVVGGAGRALAADALRRALVESRCALFVGDALPADEGWSGLLGARVVRRESSPVLRFESSSWEDLLAKRSRNLREQVGRRARKLEREGRVAYRLSSDPRRLSADLDALFALHRARRPTGSSFSALEGFHRDFARTALERGWARLWFLDVDDVPRAAWYGFRLGGVEAYYQAGRDPAWDRHSVGFVLLAHTIRAALEDGMREYRFLRGDEAFKYRFADGDPGLETIAIARGALAAGLLAAGLKLPRPLLRRLAR